MKQRVFHNCSGFTLIELMIALVIMALSIGSYVASNAFIQKNTEESFERTVALQDASRVIERMRNTAQIEPTIEGVKIVFPNNVTRAFPDRDAVGGFSNLSQEQVVVTYTSTTTNPLEATVRVTWRSYNRRTSSIEIKTLITQR